MFGIISVHVACVKIGVEIPSNVRKKAELLALLQDHESSSAPADTTTSSDGPSNEPSNASNTAGDNEVTGGETTAVSADAPQQDGAAQSIPPAAPVASTGTPGSRSKVINLSGIVEPVQVEAPPAEVGPTAAEKLAARAARFGEHSMSEAQKAALRAARFGEVTNKTVDRVAAAKAARVEAMMNGGLNAGKRVGQKRKSTGGASAPSRVPGAAPLDPAMAAALKARVERFGLDALPADKAEEIKRQRRAERFSS